jgi:hypothetical protein
MTERPDDRRVAVLAAYGALAFLAGLIVLCDLVVSR